MINLESKDIELILQMLSAEGYLMPGFQLYRENNELKLLGVGGFSQIYDMVSESNHENHYALKVTGFMKHTQTSVEFWDTSRIQGILGSSSPYVVRAIYGQELVFRFCENVISDVHVYNNMCDEAWDEEDESIIHIQCMLMERLDVLVAKDRFNKVGLLREELRLEENVIKFAMDIGQALLTAHDSSVLHRDIKLENCFWDDTNKVYKLGDFGIAKYTGGDNAETIVYTDGYGAPEIERHLNDSYNSTADIYSFGITLYLLLNDLRFPGSGGYYARTELQYNSEYIFPAPANASVKLTRVIRKLCSYRPEDRYQYIGEALYDIANIGTEHGVEGADEILNIADVATVTFREDKPEEDDPKDVTHDYDKPVTREERALDKWANRRLYIKDSLRSLGVLTILLTLFIQGMEPSADLSKDWLFFILPIGLLVSAFFQRVQDFHIVFGTILIIFSVISIIKIGLTIPHIIVMLFAIIGIPGLSVAGSISIGLWMLINLVFELKIFGFIYRYDLAWILLIVIFVVAYQFFVSRIYLKQTNYYRAAIMEYYVYRYLFIAMAIIGIVLFILQKCDVIMLPDLIERMHFARVGVACYVCDIIIHKWLVDKDEIDECIYELRYDS